MIHMPFCVLRQPVGTAGTAVYRMEQQKGCLSTLHGLEESLEYDIYAYNTLAPETTPIAYDIKG